MKTAIEVDIYNELGLAEMRFKLLFRVSVHVSKVQIFKLIQPESNLFFPCFFKKVR